MTDRRVRADISLVADSEVTTPVTLTVDGTVVDETSVRLGPLDGVVETSLTWDVPTKASGSATLDVTVDGDVASEAVALTDGPFFDIVSVSTPQGVDPGVDVDVGITVENIGTASDSDTVSVDIDGGGSDQTSVALDPDETTVETLTAAAPDAEAVTTLTAATSDETVTRDLSIGAGREPRAGSDGWFVELDLPSGNTLRPDVVADANVEPGINDMPRVEIPVRQRERWFDMDLDIPMRVWLDGQRLPIDELVDVERDAASGRDRLVGLGSKPLRRYRESIDVPDGEVSDAVRSLLAETPLQADVDDPDVETREDVLLRETASVDDWDQHLDEQPTDTSLWGRSGNGGIQPRQTTNVHIFTQSDINFLESVVSGIGYHNSEAYSIRSSGIGRLSSAEGSVSLDHRIPEKTEDGKVAAGVAIRLDVNSDGHPAFRILVNNSIVERVREDAIRGDINWYNSTAGGPLPAGDIEVGVDTDPAPDGNHLVVDAIAVYDRRVDDVIDDDGVFDGIIQGVDLYPEPDDDVYAETRAETSVEAIQEATVTQSIDTAASGREVGVTVTDGAEWSDATGDSVTLDADSKQEVRSRHLLVGVVEGGDADTPAGRASPMTVESVTLEADVAPTPLVLDKQERGSLRDILNDLADQADALWEVQWDAAEQRQRVGWTYPGQRKATRLDAVVDISARKTTQDAAQRVVAFGVAEERQETFEGPAAGESARLDDGYLVPGSEVVRDPESGQRLRRGIDYDADYLRERARITRPKTKSRLAENQTYEISYRAKIRAEHIAADYRGEPVDELRTREIDDLAVTSQEAAGQVALAAAEELAEPQVEADVVVSEFDPTQSLLGQLGAAELPIEPQDMVGLDVQPGRVEFALANRESVGDVVSGLRRSVRRAREQL